MTIYTFGDPFIVREALLALATIFSSGEWIDGGNGFGLGGNFLAAALIGLLGILIAGINTQAMRIDYLLTAFIIFAIAFSVDVDVNIEDIQTGDASVVADVPVGVAVVASLSSSAAVSITETVSTALQRPGSPTAVLADKGFLNPLKELLQMRNIELKELDPYLYETILSYYRFCIGKTEQNDPTIWRMNAYLADPNPWEFFVNTANVQNWTTIYYDEANPGGIARACYDVAPDMDTRMGEITDGTTDEALRYLRSAMGPEQYNVAYEMTSIESAVDLLFRSTLTSQQYMANAMLTNLHNEGEAWKIAEYGSNKAQYVATLTEAFETKAIQATTEGSIFLQYMFPLMGFIQFLFFMLPPIIAFMIIASPFQAPKLIGSYALLGVAAYGWLPVAAVINHYMQIAMANEIQYAGLDLLASGHTAITGFNSLYNSLATRLVIGSNALAATPLILGAILTLAPATIANLTGRFSGGGAINTSIAAPKLAENGPVFKKAAMAAAGVGATTAATGAFFQASTGQKDAYGQLSISRALSDSATAAQSRIASLKQAQTTRVETAVARVNSVVNKDEIEVGQKARQSQAIRNAMGSVSRNVFSETEQEQLQGGSMKRVEAAASAKILGNGVGYTDTDYSNLTSTEQAAVQKLVDAQDEIVASMQTELANTGGVEQEVQQDLRNSASEIKTGSTALEAAESYSDELKRAAASAHSLSRSHSMDTVDIARTMLGRRGTGVGGALSVVRGAAARAGILDEVDRISDAKFMSTKPIGLDGRKDSQMDAMDRVSSALLAMEELAKSDPRAGQAFVEALEMGAGFSLNTVSDSTTKQWASTEKVDDEIGSAQARMSQRVEGGMERTNARIDSRSAETENLAGAVSDLARGRENIDAFGQSARSQVMNRREQDRASSKAGLDILDSKIEGAMREMEKSPTRKLMGYMSAGESGFDAQAFQTVQSLPAGFGEKAEKEALALVAEMEGMATAQGDREAEPLQTYKEMRARGYSPRVAAAGALGEFGYRTSGAMDALLYGGLLGAGASGAAELKGRGMEVAQREAARQGVEQGVKTRIGRSLIQAVKVGGPGIGIAATLAGAAVYRMQENRQGQDWDKQLMGDIMQGTEQVYGNDMRYGGQQRFKEFKGFLEKNPVQNSQELLNAVSEFYEKKTILGDSAGQSVDTAGAGYQSENYQEMVDVLSRENKK